MSLYKDVGEVEVSFPAFLPSAIGVGKGKAIPLQAWTGPEVSRRLKLLDFKTIGT